MNEQLSLFTDNVPLPPPNVVYLPDPSTSGRGLVSRDGSPTSQAAADLVAPRSGTQRMVVLEAFADAGIRGLTDEELCESTGYEYNQAGPRRRELRGMGWVQLAGRTRKSRFGADQEVWRMSDAGMRSWGLGVAAE